MLPPTPYYHIFSFDPGAPDSKLSWKRGLAPGFSKYWVGGQTAPQIANIGGGQEFENPNISSTLITNEKQEILI